MDLIDEICICKHLSQDHVIERTNPYTKIKELHCVYCACHGFTFPIKPGNGFIGWEVGCHWEKCEYRTNGWSTADECNNEIREHIKNVHLTKRES